MPPKSRDGCGDERSPEETVSLCDYMYICMCVCVCWSRIEFYCNPGNTYKASTSY
jgi:hypothetical protein